MSRARRRDGLVDWMGDEMFTHAITLAPNRPNISFDLLRRMFSSFCYEVDRYVLDINHPYLRNSHDRLQMIVMPEKLGVNPHLHGVANLSASFMGDRLNERWELRFDNIWRSVSGEAGGTDVIAAFDRGLLRYFAKEALRSDHEYLHSWDFHRGDKLRRRPDATTLQSVTTKKAVLNS
jgi:hypothetical protein